MNKFLILFLSLSMVFFFGCSEDDDKDVNEFEVLVEYLEGDDGGYINNMGSWIKNAGVLDAGFDYSAYTVLDIRSAEAFASKSIPGAINTTMTDMWTHAESSTKPILVACYSGQSASYAHMLLRLKGYEAYEMKFGMSVEPETENDSWDKWTVKCVDTHAGALVTTASPTLPSFDYPEIDTGYEDAEDILDARIDAAIAAWGTLLKSADAVIPTTDDYNVVNYWPEADYLNYGHIDGAYQVTPATLTRSANLSVFDPNSDNIFYCYTGQTAASSIAYLYVIGYENVYSIAYGFNNMNWTALSGHKWSKPFSN